jgi:fumarate reductase subunit D
MDSDSPLTWEKLELKKTNYLLKLIIIFLLILIIFIIIHHIDHIKTHLKSLDKSIYQKKEIKEDDNTYWNL